MQGRKLNLEIDGHQLAVIAYNEDAAGPPVVLIHGVLASVNFWHPEHVPWLAGRRWYSLGLPAHYPSKPPEDFDQHAVDAAFFHRIFSQALQQLLGDEPAVLVGHSTGGFAALNLSAHEPERVRAVVSVGGFAVGKFGGVEGLLQRFSLLGPKLGQTLYNGGLQGFAVQKDVCRWLSVPLANRWRAYLRWPGLKPTFEIFFPDTQQWYKRAMRHMFEGIYHLDIRAQLPKVTVPVLVIAGEKDPVIPFAHARELEQGLPQVEFKPLAGVGHMPFAEVPDEYEKLLADWLARHAVDAGQAAAG